MSKESFDKQALIKYRLECSREALDDARLMKEVLETATEFTKALEEKIKNKK